MWLRYDQAVAPAAEFHRLRPQARYGQVAARAVGYRHRLWQWSASTDLDDVEQDRMQPSHWQ